MDVARPWTALVPTLEGDVLSVLAGTTVPLTAREVHRLCRSGSEQGVRDALNRLVRQGVVHGLVKGHSVLYSLNRAHLVTPAVETLAGMRMELHSRIRAEVGTWHMQPLHLSMYGSAARGDGDVESDVDLFLVRPDLVVPDDDEWQDQVARLAESIFAWTGNRASILEQSVLELHGLFVNDSPLVQAWSQDAIHLAGLTVLELIERVS